MKLKFFARWWAKASPEEKVALARAAKSSYVSLAHIAGGARDVGPGLAGRIEAATAGALRRGELSVTCAGCRYYQDAIKRAQRVKGEG